MADSKTLVYADMIQRVGYTVIDGVKVVQHTCTFPIDKPQEMRVGSTRLNPEMYKTNRDICRVDMAAFEDAAYELQDEYLARTM